MARLSLVPKDREFFNLFEEAGSNLLHAAQLLTKLMKAWPDAGGLGREILICEQEGDRITHDIIHRLNSTSVTPIDREDIYGLASSLDDVVDFIEEAADFMGLYNIEAPMEQALKLTAVLEECCRNIAQALTRLRGFQELNHFLIEVNRLENEGDRITREALASLFRNGIDPMVVIRWKDIFDRLEDAIDATEKVANVLEGIVVKHT